MVLSSSFSRAEEASPAGLKITEAVVATGVENMTPEGVSETFPASVGKLYVFTRVIGAKEEIQIKHRWFYGERLLAEIRLPVKSMNWRTYSSKIILLEWTGEWKVDIATQDGSVLRSLTFTVQ